MTSLSKDEKHKAFVGRLKQSSPAVFAVARYLHEQGFDLNIPAKRYTPNVENHLDYVDNGDIEIRKDGGQWERVEVKGIKTMFTTKYDWPYDFIIVSNQKAIDRADPLPRAYFIVSDDLDSAAIIKGSSKPHWKLKSLTPKTTGREEVFYVADISIATFVELF